MERTSELQNVPLIDGLDQVFSNDWSSSFDATYPEWISRFDFFALMAVWFFFSIRSLFASWGVIAGHVGRRQSNRRRCNGSRSSLSVGVVGGVGVGSVGGGGGGGVGGCGGCGRRLGR